MGYYSTLRWVIMDDVILDDEKCKELEKFFEDNSNEDIYGFWNVKIARDEKGKFQGIETAYMDEAKFYDDELFVEKFSKCIKKGELLIYFIGEDSFIWGYLLKPGKYEDLLVYFVPLSEKQKMEENVKSYELII